MKRERGPTTKNNPRRADLDWGQKSSLRCFSLVVLVFSMATSAWLQAKVGGGTLSSTVADTSGAVVPKARIVITNAATGVTRNITTNADGFYTAPNLLPGAYEPTFPF